jgi:RHS repeat-associated protein
MGKAQDDPNTDYSPELKRQVTDYTVAVTYNGDDLRTQKVVKSSDNNYTPQTTSFLYDRQHVTVETDEAGTVITRYVRGINYIAQYSGVDNGGDNGDSSDSSSNISSGGSVGNGNDSNEPVFSYFLFNGRGDTVQTVTQEGEIQNQYDYDIFGSPTLTIETAVCPIRYAGEYLDNETGLYYLRARYYDPYIGRFISEDSYWGEDNNPLSLNLYKCCYNNPIRFIDPSGHNAEQIDVLIGKIDIMKELWWEAQKNTSISVELRKEIQNSANARANQLRAELAELEKGNEAVEQLVKQSGDDAGTWEGYKLSVTMGKAQDNPDDDYSPTLKKQVTDYALAVNFNKNSNGISSDEVQESIKTHLEEYAEFVLSGYQTEKAELSKLQQAMIDNVDNAATGKNTTAMLLSTSSSVLASARYMGDFQLLNNKTETTMELLYSLVDAIDTYPKSTVWNLWGLWKTKAQKSVISEANDIKDRIKQSNEYLNDKEFRKMVDEVFSEKSYKKINKKDDIQRLIDYLVGRQPDPTATPSPSPTPYLTMSPTPIPTPMPPTLTPIPKDYVTISKISELTAVEGYQKVYIEEIKSFAYIYITNSNERVTFSIGASDEHERVSKIAKESNLNPIVVTNAGFYDTTIGTVEHFGALIVNGTEWETVSMMGGVNKYEQRVAEANTFIQWSDGTTEIRKITKDDIENIKQNSEWAVGAEYSLVQGGNIAVTKDNKTSGNNWFDPGLLRSRTMFGVNQSGNYISVVVERSKTSRGAYAYEEARIMHQLGAINAINFDGGGSSTFWYNGSTRNTPEYDAERPIGSVMMVIPR